MSTTVTAPAVPTNQGELEDILQDMDKVQASIKAGQFATVIQNYSRAVAKQDMDIKAQVAEQVQATLVDFLKDNAVDGIERPNLSLTAQQVAAHSDAAARKGGLHNPRALGAAIDKDYKGPTAWADYFGTIWHNADRTGDVQARLTRIKNAFSSTVPSEGGFLIPETLRSEMLRVSLETSIVRPRARVIPMESLRVPFPAVDSTSNVSSVYGGIVAYWTEEGATLTASQAAFSRIVLEAKKLTAYTEVPNELIADSIGSFQAFLDDIFPEALGFYEDLAFLKGSGVGEPLGALNTANGAIVAVAKESGQLATTIVWENLVKMFARMLPSSLNRAVWVASPDTFPELATMALSVGTGGAPVWLSNGAAGPPMTILGRPVIFTEKATGVLGAQGDISFVDFGFYLVGDRQVMSAMSSPHFKFSTDVTAYRIISRLDGTPWLRSAITPQNAGPTLSPFVQLAVRA